MSKSSIRLNIQEPARAREIFNASQLQRATGLTNKTAYGLWSEDVKMISFDTLETLCRAFECGVETILIYTPPAKGRSKGARKNGDKNREQAKGAQAQSRAKR